ncbi:acyl-CoA carboxylase subunit epsilon [Streptomyces sp. NPDC096191]|uniref:acyl-CoA carboxylase subunit epsilon n=1 Tax=Streptomyces sp. NPDC096191 TaxID=3155426 RepID=UPI003319CA76
MAEHGAQVLALRIERGRADEEELAALTAVLFAVLTGRNAETAVQEPPGVPPWPRPERSGSVYRSPYCWR